VAILKRLAAGVGRMLPMLSLGRRGQVFAEPQELLGVLLSNPAQIADLEESLSMLRGRSQSNLLISGPTGAGKSVMARRVARDVLGLEDVEAVVLRVGDPQFLITQLTGAKKGEYTGATDREGAIQRCLRLKRALFLDEVQNLDEAGQQILLPLLELPERYFGGLTASSAPLGQDLHIILGTNAEVGRGRWAERFREDLWYRMSAVHLALPPLRDRGPQAIYLYLASMLAAQEAGRPEEVFDVAALHRVTSWEWPGNLRQLQRFAERAAHLHRSTGQALRSEQLARLGLEDEALESAIDVDAEGIDQAVVDTVWQALRRNAFVQSKAATDLHMNPSRLNKFLKRHNLLDEVARQRRELRRDEG
jgi:DNA-binding NtrC family response regulator